MCSEYIYEQKKNGKWISPSQFKKITNIGMDFPTNVRVFIISEYQDGKQISDIKSTVRLHRILTELNIDITIQEVNQLVKNVDNGVQELIGMTFRDS